MKSRFASIDIGTNTLLMTIAEINEKGEVKVLEDFHKIARLGYKVDMTKNISLEAIERATTILNEYRSIIDKYEVNNIRIIGTSALRDASNRELVISELEKVIKNKIDIISGDEEAKLSFIGTIESNQKSLIIDIGGGSTEIIYGNESQILFRKSIDIGAVRITERFISNLPPTLQEINNAKEYVNLLLSETLEEIYEKIANFDDELKNNNIKCYAVAGTATTITSIASGQYEFDYEKIHNYFVETEKLNSNINSIARLTKTEMELEYKVNSQRSDILFAGALILFQFLKIFKLQGFYCSCKGLRYGPIIEYSKTINSMNK